MFLGASRLERAIDWGLLLSTEPLRRVPVDIGMAQERRASTLLQARRTRRGMLFGSLLAPVALVACGDESSTRQFAGGPQTPGTEETPASPSVSGETGSPTAVPTQMPIAQLLAPRGTAPYVDISGGDRLSVIDIVSGIQTEAWSNPDRAIWATAATPNGERIALLTAPKGASSGWSIDFVAPDGEPIGRVELGARSGTPEYQPDAVVAGRGGLAWIGESSSVAVGVPSGGLLQVYSDGSKVRLLSASSAKRPAAVAVTSDGGTIAYIDQPTGSDGSGIYAGSMKAKPIDPVVVLPADRSGNRYAHELAWIDSGDRVATVIEREELGQPQGDLFYVDTTTGTPTLAWTSPAGRDVWSVESFTVSDDGVVIAFVTNSRNSTTRKPSSVWLMQIGGAAIERFELPVELAGSNLVFSPDGLAIGGMVRSDEGEIHPNAAYLVTPNGKVVERYFEATAATPVASPDASPEGSPIASPVASPVASPMANPSPEAVTELA